MTMGLKEWKRMVGLAVTAACAVFVCALFSCYALDLAAIRETLRTPAELAAYSAISMTCKIVCAVTGGCLVLTSAVLLLFYIYSYIDAHAGELGILKALGYGAWNIAARFFSFGAPVLIGCAAGVAAAGLYLPTFYEQQNTLLLVPRAAHPLLLTLLVILPAVGFAAMAVLFARIRLRAPALALLRRTEGTRTVPRGKREDARPFLPMLRRANLRAHRLLTFFTAFSAFCFSSLTQMSFSMRDYASRDMALIMLVIGLLLAVVTLLLSLSTLVRGSAKPIAMLRVFGYSERECASAVLGVYYIPAAIGFAVGTLYQYLLLRIMVTVVFSDVADIVPYHFRPGVMLVSLVLFVAAFTLTLYVYARRLRHIPLKCVMQET